MLNVKSKSRLTVAVALAVIILFVGCPRSEPSSEGTWYVVKTVLDGDTIILADNRRVRYLGIDTPELGHGGKPGQPYSREARDVNASIVQKSKVALTVGAEPRDRYGRTLAYVTTQAGVEVNLELIRRGAAFFLADASQERKFDRQMLKIQRQAMADGVGMWQDWREPPVPSGGYVGNRRSRRFHHPDCREARKISPRNRQRLDSQWRAFNERFAPARGCMQP